MAFLHDPAFWVAIAFIGFIGVALYFKLPGMLAKTLDERAAKIKHELEEAQRLREEAQALFAEYQRKTRGAEKDLEDLMTRRAAMAEAKIAQAEAQAVQDVRNAAVDVAVAAAERLLAQEMAGDKADALLDQSISELKTKLH